MNEIWMPIKGYEGLYEVSNMGRIKSLARKWIGKNRYKSDHIMKGGLMKGYKSVTLCKEGGQITPKIHRLVAIHFIPNPDNKCDVNHKNGDKLDNRVSNLEWNTEQENTIHSFENGLQKAISGKLHYKSKMVKCDTLDIEFENIQIASRSLGVCRSSIGIVCNSKSGFVDGLSFRFIN